MDGFFAVLKQIFDAFGNYITVPIIIYIICRIFQTPRKRSFQSAVLVGVGLNPLAPRSADGYCFWSEQARA